MLFQSFSQFFNEIKTVTKEIDSKVAKNAFKQILNNEDNDDDQDDQDEKNVKNKTEKIENKENNNKINNENKIVEEKNNETFDDIEDIL